MQFTNIRIDMHAKTKNTKNKYWVFFQKGGDKLRQIKYLVENITIENVYTTDPML